MLKRERAWPQAGGPRVIFINRFFHPDHSATSQMVSDVAFALAARGHGVAVITSRQLYEAPNARLPARESLAVDIHRIWGSRFGRSGLVGRAADYATFYISAAWKLWRLAGAHDIVVVKTDPPMLSVIAAPIARARRAHVVNWLQDIFPEIAESVGLGRGRLARIGFPLLRALRDRSLRGAAANVVVGERMGRRLAASSGADRIRVIQNWADGTLVRPIPPTRNALRSAWGLQGAFVVGYSGNLGRAHEYATLLEAIATLETKRAPAARHSGELVPADRDDRGTLDSAIPNIQWVFVGGGAHYRAFEAEARRRGLASVQFRPYQPRERLAESLSAADVHLGSLRPELEGLVVPSKFYGIAAAGRPAIFIGARGGEIARLLARHACGRTVAEGDGADLARVILELAADEAVCRRMGENARQAFDTEFDKAIAVARWEALLAEMAATNPAQRSSIADGRGEEAEADTNAR